MAKIVSDAAAEAARKLVADWAAGQGVTHVKGPTVHEGAHEGLDDSAQVLIWEEGPEDWTYLFRHSPEAEAFTEKAGVWFEAVNHCILAIYPFEGYFEVITDA